MINKSRLNVQSKRLTLLSGLKDFVISKLSESLKDKKVYNATMKKMIIQVEELLTLGFDQTHGKTNQPPL